MNKYTPFIAITILSTIILSSCSEYHFQCSPPTPSNTFFHSNTIVNVLRHENKIILTFNKTGMHFISFSIDNIRYRHPAYKTCPQSMRIDVKKIGQQSIIYHNFIPPLITIKILYNNKWEIREL